MIKIYFLSLFLLLKKRIKIIHVANPPDFFWPLGVLCKIFNIKFIYDQHDLAPEMFKLKFNNNLVYKILLWNEKLTVKNSDMVIVVNNSFQERLKILWGLNNDRCSIVANGPRKDFEPKRNPILHNKYRKKKYSLYWVNDYK